MRIAESITSDTPKKEEPLPAPIPGGFRMSDALIAEEQRIEDEEEAAYEEALERAEADATRGIEKNLLVIYSDKRPPEPPPWTICQSEGTLWVVMAEGTMRADVWQLTMDGKWSKISDERFGTVKHVLMQRANTILGLTAVTDKNIPKFTKVVEMLSKNGNIAKSQLPDKWIKWMDKLDAETSEALCELLSITDDIRAKPTKEGRRLIDLSD
ncbi:hypothetical protein CC53_gp015 [Rhizobium phage vB_RleS_L338C]|uniref:hypothetical protein n=1 Tax=Rhizobium phage vB_RleS_L338C TaxID=1414737 RepID=UPI0003D82E8F|nr:hypothetical protein CC53_gp015 [Rhizobium phage vB_RleS_L338C]AHC30432.1 hypothetical protein L338C_015 [Rhizobium phage vB_RleS_L338C]